MAVGLIQKSGELDQLRKISKFSENGFFLEKTNKKWAVILEPPGPDFGFDSFDRNVVSRHPELGEVQNFGSVIGSLTFLVEDFLQDIGGFLFILLLKNTLNFIK